MKPSHPFELQPLLRGDLVKGLVLSDSAGWNQTLEDWQIILDQQSRNNWMAIHQGELVGTAMTIAYGEKFEWVGMVLVKRNFQRKGIGRSLMCQVMQNARLPILRLDASEMGMRLYERLGFMPVQYIFRFLSNRFKPFNATLGSTLIHVIGPQEIPIIDQYDLRVVKFDRSPLLQFVLEHGMGFYHQMGNEISGYVLGRKGSKYFQVGPLVANTPEIALALIDTILNTYPGGPVIVDLVDHSKPVIDYLQRLGFIRQRTLMRMSYGEESPRMIPASVFGIMDPAMG